MKEKNEFQNKRRNANKIDEHCNRFMEIYRAAASDG